MLRPKDGKKKIVLLIKDCIPKAVWFTVSFLSSAFGFSGIASPFGAAISSAAPVKYKASASAGAAAGYFFGGFTAWSLSCLAVCSLCLIFDKKEIEITKTFTSLSLFVFLLTANTVATVSEGITPQKFAVTAALSASSAAVCYLAGIVFENGSPGVTVSVATMIISGGFCSSLYGFEVWWLNFGYMAACFLLLVANEKGKMMSGIAYGVTLGLMTAIAERSVIPIACFSVSGLLMGILPIAVRIVPPLLMITASGVLPIFGTRLESYIISSLAAAIVYIIIPSKVTDKAKERLVFPLENSNLHGSIKERLLFAAKGIDDAADIIERENVIKNDDIIFEKIKEKYCKSCGNRFSCYGKNHDKTEEKIMTSVGGKTDLDFCKKQDRITAMIKEETKKTAVTPTALRTASETVRNLSYGMENVRNDKCLERYLISKGERYPEATVSDRYGVKMLTIRGSTAVMPSNDVIANEISELYGREYRMTSAYCGDGYYYELMPKPKYRAILSSACCGKDGNGVCGDSVAHFETPDGRYFTAISDGMGSGKAAGDDSRMTVGILKSLLSVTADGKAAMSAVNTALLEKNDGTSFATVDVMALNLHNGKADFIKSGAVPSFVKRGGTVFEISSSSPPVGLTETADYGKTSFSLRNGDTVILMSDGIYSETDDIRKEISGFSGLSPAEITEKLIKHKSNDDKTVVAVRIVTA